MDSALFSFVEMVWYDTLQVADCGLRDCRVVTSGAYEKNGKGRKARGGESKE